MNDSIAIVIPARYASLRLPGKPLRLIAGKPMIQWVWENACKVLRANKIIVATDSKEIKTAVEGFGGEVRITSSVHPSGTDRVAEVAASIDETIIINVQGDEPFLSPQKIDAAIDTLWGKKDLQMGSLMSPVKGKDILNDPTEVRVVVDNDSNALYFSRAVIPYARDFDKKDWHNSGIPYYNHVGIYAYRREFLLNLVKLPTSILENIEKLEQLRVLENGYKIKMKIVDESSICVDTEEDLVKANNYANSILNS